MECERNNGSCSPASDDGGRFDALDARDYGKGTMGLLSVKRLEATAYLLSPLRHKMLEPRLR